MNKEGYVLNIGIFLHLLQYEQMMHSCVTALPLIHECYKYTVLSEVLMCVY